MGKWQRQGARFKKAWLEDQELCSWVQPVEGDQAKAFCSVCKKNVTCNLKDLRAHGRTKFHKKKANPEQNVVGETSKEPPKPMGSKTAALKIAAHIACHSSVLTVDHLGALIKDITQKRFSMHRTKCTMLIRKVLGPEMHNEFLEDLKQSQYSLIIDESLDPSYEKQLRIVIRYFSLQQGRIVTSFLGLLPFDGVHPDFAVLNFLKQNRLNIADCCSIATDGSDDPSEKNDIIAKFIEYNRNIIHIKCMCSSLQFCMVKAFRVLPRNLEFMILETYNWFLRYPKHQSKYKHMFQCINFGDHAMKAMLSPDSKWIVAAPCLNKVLEHYDELKLYFQLVQAQENSYTAEILFHMYDDPINKLYFSLLQPITNEFSRVYKLTEGESVSTYKIAREFMGLYKRLIQMIVKSDVICAHKQLLEINIQDPETQLPLGSVDFGAKFAMVLNDFIVVHPTQIEEAKRTCWDFVFGLTLQLRLMLPQSVQILDNLSSLLPSVVLGPKKPRLTFLPFLTLYGGDLMVLNAQWRRLEAVRWRNNSDQAVEAFWSEVAGHVDDNGQHDFNDLGTFMTALLTMPLTNSAVEKIFQNMNLVRSKPRNRMGHQLLENILRVRAYMKRNRICCDEFMPTDKMIDAFRADIYKADVTEELEIEVITNPELELCIMKEDE